MTWQVQHELAALVADTDGAHPDTGFGRPWLVSRDLAVLAVADRQLTQLQVFFEDSRAVIKAPPDKAQPTEFFEHALSPWGPCVLGMSSQGLTRLSFAGEIPWDPLARSACAPQTVHPLFRGDLKELRLQLQGSAFELAVWRALLSLPRGGTTTYGTIARQIGQPRAARAVGAAVGRNPVAWVVPCHRVLPATGGMGGFRWGVPLKRLMLQAEGVDLPAS